MGSKIKTERNWFLIIIGAIFTAPALFVLIAQLATPLYEATRMQFWQPVEAKLLSSEVKSYPSDTTTYKVFADYTYQVNGRVYEGDRVSLHTGSDNIGDYHQEMGRELRRSANELTVYYDPDNPEDSIIDRSIRWGMMGFLSIFGVVFGMIGVGVMWLGWGSKKHHVSAETHEKPWLSKPEWKDNKIKCNSSGEMYAMLFFCTFWNLISWPVVLLAAEEIYNEAPLIVFLLVMLFPLIGLFLIYSTVKAVKQKNRFGDTPLTLSPFPGSIGGQIGGHIELNKNASELANYTVKAVCVSKYYSGSGKNRSLKEKLIWEDVTYANYYAAGEGEGIEFCIDVPAGLPETEIDEETTWHEWRLEVESEDIKLNRSFDIPVYETKQRSTVRYQVSQHFADFREQNELASSLPLQEQGDEVRIHYPMFYKPTNKLVVLGVALLILGVISAYKDEIPSFIYWVVMIITGLLSFFSAKGLLSSITIVLKNQTLNIANGLLGFVINKQQIPFSDVEMIRRREIMRSKNGKKHAVHYSVLALLISGKKVCIAKQVVGDSAAIAIEDYFRDKLNLTTSEPKR